MFHDTCCTRESEPAITSIRMWRRTWISIFVAAPQKRSLYRERVALSCSAAWRFGAVAKKKRAFRWACHKRIHTREAELNCEANHVRMGKTYENDSAPGTKHVRRWAIMRGEDSLFSLPAPVATYGSINLHSINNFIATTTDNIDTFRRSVTQLRTWMQFSGSGSMMALKTFRRWLTRVSVLRSPPANLNFNFLSFFISPPRAWMFNFTADWKFMVCLLPKLSKQQWWMWNRRNEVDEKEFRKPILLASCWGPSGGFGHVDSNRKII